MSGLIFHLIAHTHWDREWYLPRAAFQARLVAVLDDLIEQLQRDPGYRSFLLDGQTVLVEDYLRARPDKDGELRALVKTGRLQVGPWYVLADELIPSGEALVRNLLLGAADAERLGGRLDVLYAPDAFGHPAIWPTLAREFGIKWGVLWRGLGGEAGQERDLYRWRGPDGRDVLAWHLPPQGYEVGATLAGPEEGVAEAWRRVRDALAGRATSRHVPVFIGADHHAAPRDLTRLRDRLAALEVESAVRVSRLDEFFQGAAADAAAAAPLSGELRWSYRYAWTLQGVHGTRAHLKRCNALLELQLERIGEPLAALARRYGGRDRRPVLELAWRTLVRCQFHDSLAGCASDAVARAVEARFDTVAAYARVVACDSLHELVGHDADAARDRRGPARPMLALWNPAARPRGGVAIADLTWFRRDLLVGPPGTRTPRAGPGYAGCSLVGPDGRPVEAQLVGRWRGTERLDAARHDPDQDEVDVVRLAFRTPSVPGLGLACLRVDEEPARRDVGSGADRALVRRRTLANRFVEVTLEATGGLALHDRRTGERFFDLLRLEDAGDAGDTYTYCPRRRDRPVRSAGPVRVRRLAAGPLVAALEAGWDMRAGDHAAVERRRGLVRVRLVVILHADSPLVRCLFEIDNQARNHRLRARAPTQLPGVPAVAGAAFGAVTRPAVRVNPADFPLETPAATAPAQRFVALARGGRGLALLAPGFFEYELTPAGDLLFTMLRAVGELSRDDLPTRPGHAGWPTATPQAQCLGAHRLELALAAVRQADLERGHVVPHLWEDAFLPVRGVGLREAVALTPAPVEVTLEGEGLVLSAVKPAHAGTTTILRCYNVTSRKTGGAWRFGDGIKAAHRVRADERESVPLVLENRGRTVRFVAEPHEIVTIMIT